MTLDTKGWAAWVLLGNDAARIPDTLKPISDRIEQAIRQAIADDRKERPHDDA